MLTEKQIDMIEVLTGSHNIEFENAKTLAIVTHGDIKKALNALTLMKRGWSFKEVVDSLENDNRR